MSTAPTTSTSQSNFACIFNAALESYERKTKKDLVSHPLLPSLQSCRSPESVVTVLREQVPAFNQSQSCSDGLTKWVNPTVNVLHSFSETIGQGVGLVNIKTFVAGNFYLNFYLQAFSPASVIFTGIGVLLSVSVLHLSFMRPILTPSQAAKDASGSQDKLIDIFNRIERFFCRLEIYTSITPTTAMGDIIVEIMVAVLTILAIATKEVKSGRISELMSCILPFLPDGCSEKYFKKVTGNRDIENSMEMLDRLTQEEARMASVEQLRMMHSVDGKVLGVNDRVRDVAGQVQDVRSDMQDVRVDVQDVRVDVQDARGDLRDVGNMIQDVDDKLDQANRLSSL